VDKKDIEKKIENDLREYINDPQSLKSYSLSMAEIDKWLKELKK
jgi:hypothetical protein